MALYGVLKALANGTFPNTGIDSEIQYSFSVPLQVKSNQPAFISDTLSLKRKANSQNVQRWEITAEIFTEDNSAEFLKHSTKYGMSAPFMLRMPQPYRKVAMTQAVNIATSASVAYPIGTTILNLVNVGSIDLSGSFITFAGDTKVYLVVNNGTSGTGLEISPALLKAVPINTAVAVGNRVSMQARYDMDTQLGITYNDGILSNAGSINFIEAL